MISLERAYPVTVGCDIGNYCIKYHFIQTHSLGTTFTGLIAAFASPGAGFQKSMQVSMSHLFFNVIGACLWFVVPIMRQIPIGVARFAGRRTALYRWWAVNYIIGFFFVLPILAFIISIFSEEALVGEFKCHKFEIIVQLFCVSCWAYFYSLLPSTLCEKRTVGKAVCLAFSNLGNGYLFGCVL